MALPFGQEFTDQTLENAPVEATELLSAIAAVAEIRATMEAAGMSQAQIEEGKSLLMKAISVPVAPAGTTDTTEAKAARAASAELNNYDEPNLPVFAAALARHFPSAGQYVFGDISPSRVASEAVAGIANMLARLNHLENGTDPHRASSAPQDMKAVELLAQRGLTKAERTRLQGLVDVALGPQAAGVPPAPSPVMVDPEARRAALLALKLWVNEWSTVGHARIKRRAHLIRMGLAERKSPKKEPGAPAVP
ncbi:MAG: hypothetical protein MUF54_05390 [Polyangiaceae bacterium]|nr:hypothetical protein [Polyangiaceae bacterium]